MNSKSSKILAYLKKVKGADFFGYRPEMVNRQIDYRMAVIGLSDIDKYHSFLAEFPDEVQNLIDALTINYSRFFRDSLTFEYFSDVVLPNQLISKTAKDSALRIWSTAYPSNCAYCQSDEK